jgi:hypothetical protein
MGEGLRGIRYGEGVTVYTVSTQKLAASRDLYSYTWPSGSVCLEGNHRRVNENTSCSYDYSKLKTNSVQRLMVPSHHSD